MRRDERVNFPELLSVLSTRIRVILPCFLKPDRKAGRMILVQLRKDKFVKTTVLIIFVLVGITVCRKRKRFWRISVSEKTIYIGPILGDPGTVSRVGKKGGTKVSSTGERAPGYCLSPNYFQKFKQLRAPEWAQKMLCIVSNWQTVSSEFFSWVCTRRLSGHTWPVRSPSLSVQGKLLFSTLLTRNEGTTNEWKKRLGCYQ